MRRLTGAVLLLAQGLFASGCARVAVKDAPALVYRYHSDGWGQPEGHALTVMTSGATRTELEQTGEAPAVEVQGWVDAPQVRRLLEALSRAGFFDMEAACPARLARPARARQRALTLYRGGRASTVHQLWACAPDPEAMEGLLTVLDEYALGKRASLEPAAPGEEERRAQAQLFAPGQALVHLNAFGEGKAAQDAVLWVGISRSGAVRVAFRATSPSTRRRFVDTHLGQLDAAELSSLRTRLEELDAPESAGGASACTITGRHYLLSWPRPRGRGEVSIIDDCPATPALAHELARDLLALGAKLIAEPGRSPGGR